MAYDRRELVRKAGENWGSVGSIAELAEKMEMTQSSFFRLFKSREDLLIEIHLLFWQELLTSLKTIALGENILWNPGVVGRLEQMAILGQVFVDRNKGLVLGVIASRCSDLDVERVKSEVYATLDAVIQKGKEEKGILCPLPVPVIREVLVGGFVRLSRSLYSLGGELSTKGAVQGAKAMLKWLQTGE